MFNKANPFKILVIGCGAIAHYWFEYTLMRDDTKIVGIVDINKANGQSAVEKFSLDCPVFTSLEEALAQVKPDLVYDLTFVTTHINIVTKCLRAGCHVFGEKPMCISREQAQEMVRVSEETGKVYSVMQNRRYQKPVHAMKELIASGRLGDIWMVKADIFVFEDLSSIRNLLEKPMLQDNAIHTFDQARFLMAQDAQTVYCHSYNPPYSKYKGDAAGTCIFEMSGGTTFVYNCVMGVEGLSTSWEADWRVIGSKGTAVWDGFGEPRAEAFKAGFTERAEGAYETFEPQTSWEGRLQHYGCIEEMFEALIAGRPSATDCHDNYKSISMTFSAIESAKKQQKIKVY